MYASVCLGSANKHQSIYPTYPSPSPQNYQSNNLQLAAMAEKGVLLMDRRIISAAVRLFTSASSSSASGDAGAREQGHDPSSFSSSSHDAAAAEEARGGRADTSSSSLSSAAAAATEEGDDILSLVAALRRVGAQLDVVHYTVAISALAKEKKTTTMEGKGGRRAVTDVKTTAVMEKTVDGKAGGAATPGVAAYDGGGGEGGGGGVTTTTAAAADALVHATGEKGRVAGGAVQRAETLLGWMAADGVRPNDMTFTSLIHLLGQARGCPLLLRFLRHALLPEYASACVLANLTLLQSTHQPTPTLPSTTGRRPRRRLRPPLHTHGPSPRATLGRHCLRAPECALAARTS